MKPAEFHENSNNQHGLIEIRHEKDWAAPLVTVIAVIGWLCAFTALMLIDRAKPETANFFSRLFSYSARGHWDLTLLRTGAVVLTVSFATCVTGLFISKSRHHKKNDHYNKAIIILSAVTLGMLIFCIIKLIY